MVISHGAFPYDQACSDVPATYGSPAAVQGPYNSRLQTQGKWPTCTEAIIRAGWPAWAQTQDSVISAARAWASGQVTRTDEWHAYVEYPPDHPDLLAPVDSYIP